MNRRTALPLLALALVAALAFVALRNDEPAPVATPVQPTALDPDAPDPSTPSASGEDVADVLSAARGRRPGDSIDDSGRGPLSRSEMLARIRALEEQGRLRTAHLRIRFLEELMGYLQRHYPETWRQELESILREAFPDTWREMMALFEAREDWAEWMRENRNDLAQMPQEERRAAMWDARRDFFGEDADNIFEAVARNETVADTLAAIDQNPTGTVQERFERYVESVQEAYGDEAPEFLVEHRTEAIDRFIGLQSVQTDLAQMPPEARYRELREIRAEAGMDEDALERWEALDQQRDARRAEGAAYMEDRARAQETLEGAALEARLAELREQHFGEEAQIIANEEESGFYRFEMQQVYGRD